MMSDCLYDSKGQPYKEEEVREIKKERPYGMKDYQIEVSH